MTRQTSNQGADLVVLSGPSGVGKSTVKNRLLDRMTELRFSVSATTRLPRNGEQDGIDYHFLTREGFKRRLEQNAFIEHAEVFGEWYGTPIEEIDRARAEGKMLLLEIDVQGGLQIHHRFPDALLVLLVPPSLMALEGRLSGRGTETPEVAARRLAEARNELTAARNSGAYTVEVVNDQLDKTVQQLERLIREHRRTLG